MDFALLAGLFWASGAYKQAESPCIAIRCHLWKVWQSWMAEEARKSSSTFMFEASAHFWKLKFWSAD